MYWVVDGCCFLLGVAVLVYLIVEERTKYLAVPICWILFYSLIIDLIYSTVASMTRKVIYNDSPASRIIYHPSYNVSFCGLEKLHPFDSRKYEGIFNRLKDREIIKNDKDFICPNKIPRSLLVEKLGWGYLIKLTYSIFVCKYIEMPLFFLPGFMLRWRVLDPMLYATEGTILACVAATKLKWSINLGGGYHHAHFNGGGGFCIYPDISLAVHYLRSRMGVRKIMIIDLDAHQGNGHERDHISDEDVYTVDFYNHNIYPKDEKGKEAIRNDVSVSRTTSDEKYWKEVEKIEEDFDKFHPDFVIYNAGTDCLVGDPLGDLSLTPMGIIQRDEKVFELCLRKKVPVTMVLSGGYQRVNAEIIAKSIANLFQKFG